MTDIARPLRADSSRAEAKRAEEKVSGWLGRWDFSAPVNPWLLGGAAASDDATYAVDFSDVSKEFGGDGMEGMAMGWDGSRGVTAMGHDFISVSLVGAEFREARPVYVKLAKGRRSKGGLLEEGLDALMEATGGLGWTVFDRGMDSAGHVRGIKAKGRKGVVRVNDMKRDVFGDGLGVEASLAPVPFRTAHLHTHRGDRRVEIRWRRGFVQHCANPGRKDAPVENVGVLVVESRFDGKSIWLYAVCPDGMYADEEGAFRVAARAAQAYCVRHRLPPQGEGVQEGAEVPVGQPGGGLPEDARPARWHTRARGRAAASVHKREAAESQAKGRAADGVRALRRPERGPPDRARSRQEAFSRWETPGGAYPQPACMAKTGPKTGPGRRFFAWESAIEESPCQFLTPLKIFLSQCFQGCDAISG